MIKLTHSRYYASVKGSNPQKPLQSCVYRRYRNYEDMHKFLLKKVLFCKKMGWTIVFNCKDMPTQENTVNIHLEKQLVSSEGKVLASMPILLNMKQFVKVNQITIDM